jgi:ABC-type uncharacterized transport system involved in gliding motility auxiliary subunit
LIVNPKDTFPESDLMRLEEFLSRGNNLYIALNRVDGNLQTSAGTEVHTGLEKWLDTKGIKINPDFIIDQNCGSVMVNQQQGYMTFQSTVRFPYLPQVTKFAKTPAMKGLTAVLLQFASSIDFINTNGNATFTPWAMTSEKSGTEKPPLSFNISRNWQEKDFPRGNLTVCGLLSGRISGNLNSRIIVASDGDFPINGSGQQARQLPPDNINFIVNAIDWLSDDTGLIDLRTKEVASRPLDQMEDGKKATLKYLNFLLPIFLILGFGIGRWQNRRNLRMRRMSDNYI